MSTKPKIYIKPSKRGSLRKHLGVSEGQKIPASKLSIKSGDSPAIRKKKQFAINARKWNHELGGMLYANGGTLVAGPVVDGKPALQLRAYGGKIPAGAMSAGVRVEKEHSGNLKIAKQVAKDHFEEAGPTYYKKLAKIGEDLKKPKGQTYKGSPSKDFMKKGIKIEHEHTGNVKNKAESTKIARKIATDHFKNQGPDYYNRLIEMEKSFAKHGYGGGLMQYGFGSWLKENGAGLLKGAGSLVSMIPAIGQIAGPILSTAGSAISGIQQKNSQEDMMQQQADELAASQAEQERLANRKTRLGNVLDTKQVNYGATFENGGDLKSRADSLTIANKNNPWIKRYLEGNKLNIPDPYNPGSGKTSSHGLSYHPLSDSTAMIFPEIVQQGDSLIHMNNDEAREYAIKNKTGITTDLELAKYYSQNGLIQHEDGGQIGMGFMNQQPQITEYSNGNTHQEGVGGIPVDAKGNPAKMSRTSAVGMTEKGEVTWNGYVFSNRLKFD
jgi:hypothetical protein